MAKITSRALLNVGTELVIDEVGKTIRLVAAGNLVAKDGVTIQAVYSKLMDLWATAAYQDSAFPMYAIDALSGQFQIGTDGQNPNGWTWFDDTTRNMLRDGGWSEYDNAGSLVAQYAGFVGLGAVNAGAQPYFILSATDAPANFPFTDQFNVGVKVFGDATHGNFDKRTFAKAFVREQGKKYKDSVLSDTGKTGTGAYLVNFLISNEDDTKIQAGDASMSGAPYSGITVGYYSTNQNRVIGGSSYPFRVIIDGNGASLEQIYTKIQYLLRQNANINTGGDAGSVTGKTASALLSFSGDTLATAQGVFIENIDNADSNRVEFYDQNNAKRTYPYTSAGEVNANAPLRGAGSSYRMMFATPPGVGDDFTESGAITVNDASGNPITGVIPADGIISFTYDYDGNVQGGFTAGTDRNVVIIGIKPGSAKYVMATGTLTRSKTMAFSLVAEQDRAYL